VVSFFRVFVILFVAASPRQEFRMRALVTGGTGFLGSFLVRRWAERYGADAVVCLVPPQGTPAETATREAFEQEGIGCVEGDLRGCPVADDLGGPFDVVFHLAAATDTSWPEERLAPINVQGTQNLLETLGGGLRGKRIVFTSTSAAVDRAWRPRGPLTECSACRPRTAYGRTKLAAEQVLRTWCAARGAEYTIARLTTLYGPGVRTGLIPVLTDGLRAGRLSARLNWPGRVSLLYVEDAVRTLLFLAECNQAANETFFLSSGEALRVGDIARQIGGRLEPAVNPRRLPRWLWWLVRTVAWMPGIKRLVPWRLLHILADGLLCDSSKVRRLCPYEFVKLEEGLERTLHPKRSLPQSLLV
jgi:nucleoside-diphosphate-sugar epimerase